MNWTKLWTALKPIALMLAGAAATYICQRYGVCS